MQREPIISIVTPVLNGANFIQKLIASLKSQTFNNWEHIIVDGGSTDETVDIVKSAYVDDPRCTLIERPGEGIYASVVEGFQIAKGRILGWQNADDFYTPWAFAAVLAFQQRTSAAWFTGLPGCWDAKETLRFVRPYGWYPRTLIRQGWFHADMLGFLQQESIFFTKPAFQDLSDSERKLIANASLAGDFILWKRLAQKQSLLVLPTVVSGFRRHSGNRSHANFSIYMKEARSDGAIDLPWYAAAFCRKIFRTLSSFAALDRVDIEDQILSHDLQLEMASTNQRTEKSHSPSGGS